jgi:hypothetical protein
MSTYKRATGNIVFETLNANSSVSFIGPTANAVSVVINGDLSVSGNASLTGNIAGDKIFNGTTSIEIPVANGNANVSVGGVSNVFVVAPDGISVSGNANVTGNAVIGNLQVNGVIAGNAAFGNLNTTGNVSITRDASLGQPTFRFSDTDTTITTNTVLGAVEWFTSDTAPGARVTTAVRSIATSATGNARYEVLTSTDGAAATAKFAIDNVGNVGVANTAPLHTFAVSGNTYVSGTATVIGNVTGGNFITAGLVSATGNITSAANIAGGNLAITANVVANNLSATTGISAGAGGITATGNIRGGNLVSDGAISSTGNLITTDIFATTLSASGNITGANLNVGGVANTNSVTAVTTVSAGGNVTGGNINSGGQVSAIGNVIGANVNSTGLVVAAGNVVAGSFFVGDGGFISNITIAANVAVTQLANGTSNWTIRGSGGNITGDVAGTSNVVIITTNTMTVTGLVSVTGNVTGGNITTAGLVSATGNIDGGNVNATIGNFNTVIGVANASNLTTGTVPSDRLTGIYTINISGYSATVSAAAQPNITSLGTLSALSVAGNITGGLVSASGNITGGNLLTGGLISATGNITGGNLLAAGLSLSGNVLGNLLPSANVTYDLGSATQAWRDLYLSGNSIKLGSATLTASGTGLSMGTGNVTGGNLTTTGITSTASLTASTTISATGNITGGNLTTAGITSTGSLTASTTISATGNVAGGNINTGGTVSATGTITAVGNITGGNIATGGLVTATGNVSGNYILGNGALLTGVITSVANINFGNSNVTVVSSGGNISVGVGGTSNVVVWATTGQYITGLITASGNIQTSGQFIGNGVGLTSIPGGNVTGTVSSATSATTAGTVTTAAQPNITSVGTLTSLSSSGNITGANINGNGSGLSSITGANVTGTVANATFATSAGSATSATTAGTVTTAAQPNITSVGTLSALSVSGNITGGNLITAGLVSLSSITKTGTNGVGNIGAAGSAFDTVFARATSALYADLAEKFLADQPYQPGTVLIFGGNKEVTISTTDADHRVAGVVSTDPSYLMNSGLTGDYAVKLALQGRVPCKVFGPVEKGDLLVSAADGHARAVKSASAGTIIGKSLQNFSGATGTIEIVVGRD